MVLVIYCVSMNKSLDKIRILYYIQNYIRKGNDEEEYVSPLTRESGRLC